MRYRAATASDTEAVAGLHADSWQRTYRGAYADSFLDGDVMADRLSVWAERLAQPRSDSITIVAEADEEPAGEPAVLGFAHTFLDHDPVWGALLDNLHVSHDRARGGVGTRLMSETARELLRRDPGSDLYLWVLEQNTSGAGVLRRPGRHLRRAGAAGSVSRRWYGHGPALRLARPGRPGDPQVSPANRVHG
jgi:predicted N-acetyltransferase YhbS